MVSQRKTNMQRLLALSFGVILILTIYMLAGVTVMQAKF
jgi:hypothetical protein